MTANEPLDCGTKIENMASATYDPDGACPLPPEETVDSNEVVNTVVSAADLSVVKSVSPEGEISPGDKLDYTLTITNTGCMNAKNVVLDDIIPANATAVGNAAASSGTVDSQDPLKVSGMTVNKGTPVTVTFSVNANEPLDCGTLIKNKAVSHLRPRRHLPSSGGNGGQ